MLVAVLAYLTARRLAPYGLYDGWLERRGDLAGVLVAVDLAEPAETAAPHQPLRDALRVMNARARDALPVVDPASNRYVGMLSRADLLAAYERELLEEV